MVVRVEELITQLETKRSFYNRLRAKQDSEAWNVYYAEKIDCLTETIEQIKAYSLIEGLTL